MKETNNPHTNRYSGNPLFPGLGVCDPHARVFGDRIYVYATHDASADSDKFVMRDWQIWSSGDLAQWRHEFTLDPAETWMGAGFSSCWATDAFERNGKYYWYLSQGSEATAVMVGDTPVGPWRDVLKKPLVQRSDLAGVAAHDPSLLEDDDGAVYMAVGFKSYILLQLNDDMISLTSAPRRIEVVNPVSPLGPGTLDDKPTLHKRGGLYYLSWGCFYAISDRLEGPYECQGSFLLEENIAPALRYGNCRIKADPFMDSLLQNCREMGLDSTFDRHGSFFDWKGQWYFICNDHGQSGNCFFRDSVIMRVDYRPDGRIVPVVLDERGVPVVS